MPTSGKAHIVNNILEIEYLSELVYTWIKTLIIVRTVQEHMHIMSDLTNPFIVSCCD